MNFSATERRLIARCDQNLSTRVVLRRMDSPDDRNARFREFCEALTATAENIKVVARPGDEDAPPAIRIGDGLTYHAIPTGPELEPFLEAVAALDPACRPEPEAAPENLAAISLAARIKVFIAPHCRFCPDVVRAFAGFPRLNTRIKVSVIDGLLFPELAAPYDIKSAPTVILNERHRWTGQPNMQEVLAVLADDDPASWDVSVFETMIREGNAYHIAELTLKAGAVPPALPDLIAGQSLSVRLGALVALEEIAEADPALAAGLVAPLWERFPRADGVAQGDILYALGIIASREAVPGLKAVLEGPYEASIKEAAREALEKLESV